MLLIRSGSDLQAQDSLGRTPLHAAVFEYPYHAEQLHDVVAEMLKHGADPDSTSWSLSPRELAINHELEDIVSIMDRDHPPSENPADPATS